jgi:hypothetical protein
MTDLLHFDDSLRAFVSALLTHFDTTAVAQGWVLRDASGHLGFISASAVPEHMRRSAMLSLQERMGAYCRQNCILDIEQPGVSSLRDAGAALTQTVAIEGNVSIPIQLLDRRIVGHDWLSPPAPGWKDSEPARFVFASVKGGVGRSTALAVLATDLARKGRKVLVIDLDLEAPGIGAMLLNPQDMPQFGVLDWLVERGVYGSDFDDSQFLLDMRAASPFALNRGLLDVVPAVGRIADQHPENVLAKISRAYLEMPKADGGMLTLLGQVQELVARLANLARYDVILIDARAGLNESTAAALLGLGGDILLFGIDTPQTFASYRYLLAHLARFPRNGEEDWLLRLHMVHAKAGRELAQQTVFRDRAYEIFNEFLYREIPLCDDDGNPLADGIGTTEFSLNDPTAAHFAWPILFDANYGEFDPLSAENQLNQAYYQSTYQCLIDGIEELLVNDEGA